MTEVLSLPAQERARIGKGGARSTRRDGYVPAVIYGRKLPPRHVAVDGKELSKQLNRHGFFTHVFEIDVSGVKEQVLPKDVQLDPLTGFALHVDFMRFEAEAEISVEVEVSFENAAQSPGIKLGGILNVVRHEVTVLCPAGAIPQVITVDLTGLNMGDVIHAGNMALPEGVRLAASEEGATIASIAAPSTGEAPSAVAESEEGEGA